MNMEKKDILECGIGGVALVVGVTTFVMELRTRKRVKKLEQHVGGLDVNAINSMAAEFTTPNAQPAPQAAPVQAEVVQQ